jgi:hypothetical protein
LRDFFSGANTKTLITSKTLRTFENVTFVDATTGERHVFNSFEEVPPDIRAKIQEAQAHSKTIFQESSVVFQGTDGQEHRYHSVEEMPPDIRAMYEQIILPELRAKLQAFATGKESPDKLGSETVNGRSA